MKVLVIGGGGREHALAWKLDQSPRVSQVYVAPGNAGTGQAFINVALAVDDFEGILAFCQEAAIDWVVVGPEDPLVKGLADYLQAANIRVFGPNQACSQFEGSKDYTKHFLNRYGIPTAKSVTVTDYDAGMAYVEEQAFPLVLKADGLCQGKGVVIAHNFTEAQEALARLLQAPGNKVVIEEFLDGEEASLLCFVSHNRIIPMETARDYKKAYDQDQGPNTGGVGVYSPSQDHTGPRQAAVDAMLAKIEGGLQAEGLDFTGILFIGLMFQGDQAKVLEFNVRFGDPETEVLLPRLESDLLDLVEKCVAGTLESQDLSWHSDTALGVVLYSQGYPGQYPKGVAIESLPGDLGDKAVLFHNGTALDDQGQWITAGGRVLTVVALGDSLEQAREKAYGIVAGIQGTSLTYREDIGQV